MQVVIVSKATARKRQIESLFSSTGTLMPMRVDGGHYKIGSFPVGRVMDLPDSVGPCGAMWSENRKDKDGKYCVLMGMWPTRKIADVRNVTPHIDAVPV